MSPPLKIGTVLAERYRITSLMGDGASGEVYEAEDVFVGRYVAIKILREEWSHDATIIARFKREIKAMTKLSGHPNMVYIYDGGQLQENGRLYFVMEVLIGRTLAREIFSYIGKEDPMPADHVFRIARDIACGVGYAHRNKIIHRDLKPGNIMLLDSRDKVIVKVLDFGLSILLETEHTNTRITRVGMVGTKGYIPPEQMKKTEEPSPALDIYAMGVILFEMLTGFRPKDPTSAATELEGLRKGLPRDVYALVDECLKSDPEERPISMEPVIERLEQILIDFEKQQRKAPKPLTLKQIRREYAWRTKWRKRVFAGVGGVALLGLLGVLGWWWPEKIHANGGTKSPVSTSATAAVEEAASMGHMHPKQTSIGEVGSAETSYGEHETTENEAEQAGTTEEESSTGDVETPHPAEQKADSTPHKQHVSAQEIEKRCKEIRELANDAHMHRRWQELLKYTNSKECWKSSSERMMLRLYVLLSLKRYQQCVNEGQRFKNAEIVSIVKICRNHLQEEP